MLQMNCARRSAFSHLLQSALNDASADITDTPIIRVDDTRLTFVSDVWTSAMKRDTLQVTWRSNPTAEGVLSDGPIEPTAASAASVIDQEFGSFLRIQCDRWTLAHDQELVRDGIPSDLPYDRMLIDRTLVAMRSDDMELLRRGAMAMSWNKEVQVGDELPSVPVGANKGMVVFARQIGNTLPIVGNWIPLSKEPLILYDGSYVVFDGPIPETTVLAAPGHRLKTLIETGLPSLDDRIIVGIHSVGEHAHGFTLWDEALYYYIELKADLIPLGSFLR